VCLITSNFIYIANAGDCRAICSIKGQLLELSEDHRPSNIKEAQRINQAGGWIESGRIKGDLSVSRGLGDFPYKNNKHEKLENQIVTADPEIRQIQKKDIDYILMGCDGIWESKSSGQMK
jgi:protein phosphatase 2C family protein 2/3